MDELSKPRTAPFQEASFTVLQAQQMIGGGNQLLDGTRLIPVIIEAVKHSANDVGFFQQDVQRLVRVQCGLALAPGIGIDAQRLFQLGGDADVIHHQTARLILENAVHAGDGRR